VTLLRLASIAFAAVALLPRFMADAHAGEVYVNEHWPIRGSSNLSPPVVSLTNECSASVYVESFVPHATITIYLNGSTVIGGPVAPPFAFGAIALTQALHTGDKITARQTVNGVQSQLSAEMIVGAMPANLPAPAIDPHIFACGQVVPVQGLTPGANVEVRDLNTGTVIGNGATPNDWGSDWDPVSTSPLVAGHLITARQSSCTGVTSADAPGRAVVADPSPITAPHLDQPVIGNDTITAHGLFTGALLRAFQGAGIGSGYATGETNWMGVSPRIAASPAVTAQQDLCVAGTRSPPSRPTDRIPPPHLVAPICPRQADAIVQNSTINATLVLLKNGHVVGYGGAAPGDTPLDIAAPAFFAAGDTAQIAEYIGNRAVLSNKVQVGGCNDAVTYHQDNQRTGWNASEKILNTSNVKPGSFGLIKDISFFDKDGNRDRIDAQPLVVNDQPIHGQGVHNVVYLATESNGLYAIDAWSGNILLSAQLGTPVPRGDCDDSGLTVGINSTPTIDLAGRTIYVMAYTIDSGTPAYWLHALDLGTLIDRPGSPVAVGSPTHPPGGGAIQFDASVQRQRAALLLSKGNVYAAFGSFCDFHTDRSRGWMMGWNAASLAPLPANEVTNTLSNPPETYLLSSIWMSGYGVAAEEDGDLFFTTGNSDNSKNTYNGTTNIQESVVKLSADLTTVESLFTPSNVFALDQGDVDFASGGVMVVPDQPGPMSKIAIAAGKDGRMFILDRTNLGGFHSPDLPKYVSIGLHCWCGPTYFKGSDGVARIVSSGELTAMTWTINTSASPALQFEAASHILPEVAPDPDAGFFTTVSSNGTAPKTSIIWAIGRPDAIDHGKIRLYAFNGTAAGGSLTQLWSDVIDDWPGMPLGGKNMNLVPTVADGRVYAPGFSTLAIYGLKPKRERLELPSHAEYPEFALRGHRGPPAAGPQIWGTIQRRAGSRIEVLLRNGKVMPVELSRAEQRGTAIVPRLGSHVVIHGELGADGVFDARSMSRAGEPRSWGDDKLPER